MILTINRRPQEDRTRKERSDDDERKKWEKVHEEERNTRDMSEGPNLRKPPDVKMNRAIPMLRSKRIKEEVKRLALKWYIGKFLIQRRGCRSPKHLTKERKMYAQKKTLSRIEEERMNWLVTEIPEAHACPMLIKASLISVLATLGTASGNTYCYK